jgi:hypothetical protein
VVVSEALTCSTWSFTSLSTKEHTGKVHTSWTGVTVSIAKVGNAADPSPERVLDVSE